MRFVKMHGLGNDFIVFDGLRGSLPEAPALLAPRVCDRHFGVGADGLVLIEPSAQADLRMRIFNPDGSEAEMCGNAIRCVARYVYERGYVHEARLRVETPAGVMLPRLLVSGGRVAAVQVDMGVPRLERAEIPMAGPPGRVVEEPLAVAGVTLRVTAVSMGNPHAVFFVEDVEGVDLATLGPSVENHPAFPRRTNVEFVQAIGPQEVRVRVWERGAGATLACGTGACAAVVAGVLAGRLDREATVHLPGGDLSITWAADGRVYMTGPAEEVFEGELKRL
ncbi:MAG: diaminopimelate epimerase [Desulfotomaculales bacterium]